MYTFTWKKYLPLIVLLLKKSAGGIQSVKLDSMDFDKGTRKHKPSCSFKIELDKGRLLTISAPVPAKEMLDILLENDTARKIIRENAYEISLNSSFELKIQNLRPALPEIVEEALQPEPPANGQ